MGFFDFLKSRTGKPSFDLSDLKFISDDHVRYLNGQEVTGHNQDCWRGIRVQNNISDRQCYNVTVYDLDVNHSLWSNNIQMTPKQMKIIGQNTSRISLRGYGTDKTGASFADYGSTLHINNQAIEKVTMHMYDRSVDIVYFKASNHQPQQSQPPCALYGNVLIDSVGQCLSLLMTKFPIADKANAIKVTALGYIYLSRCIALHPGKAHDSYRTRCLLFKGSNSKNQLPSPSNYSTVTDFARFLG